MRPSWVLVMVAGLLVAPNAGAQNPNATDPTMASPKLWAMSTDGTDRTLGWMSTDKDDSANDETSVGGLLTETCTVPMTTGLGLPPPLCNWPAFDWIWTWTLKPDLRAAANLDPAGKVKVVAFLGAGTGVDSGGSGLDVSTSLMQGERTIATSAVQAYEYAGIATGSPYPSIAFEFPVSDGALAAGVPLVWTVHVAGAENEAHGNLFMSVSEARGRSTIELPILPPADGDGDGLLDSWESTHFGDTAAQDGTGDPDADGLTNAREQELETDPMVADTDGDGFKDGAEDAAGTDPLDPDSKPAGTPAPPTSSGGTTSKPPSTPPGPGSTTSGPAATTTAASDDKGTPAPAWLALAGLAAVVIALRRRA